MRKFLFDSLIDGLMNQKTMAPFVCTQLIQHLVTSNPSPTYIQRCSNVFLNDGNGVRGDLKAIIREILTDSEARAGDEAGSVVESHFGHMREPVLFMANILRGLYATLTTQSTIYASTNKLGQDLFYAPSVFSYFSPQYRTEKGLLGPEFQIYSTQTAANRADIVNSVLYGSLDRATTVDLTTFVQAEDLDGLISLVNSALLHGSMSDNLNTAARAAASAAATAAARARAVLYIVLTSGEYQIIH